MRLTERGLAHLRQFEGLRLGAYTDVAGHLTIGYGHKLTGRELRTGELRTGVAWAGGISRTDAEALLAADVADAEEAVGDLVRVPLRAHQWDALVSFAFNLGRRNLSLSTLLAKLNAGDYAAVPRELAKWVNAGGARVPGLVRRRAAEAAMWEACDAGA